LEIGPLDSPLIQKGEADITYVDRADTETLREKFASHPAVSIEQIVGIDAIWGEQTLRDTVGKDRRFDYVLASHVVEHVPDLVGWLQELTDILRNNGEIRLAVPDKRYTFDHLRRETRLADVLATYVVRARVPQPQQILDFQTEFSELGLEDAWLGRRTAGPPTPNVDAWAGWQWMASEAASGVYHDVHCWVFTPHSLARLFAQLGQTGLLVCECSLFQDTLPGTHEFMVGLRPCTNREQLVASWLHMASQAKAEPDMEKRVGALEAELNALKHENSLLRSSTSWRVTEPLRAISSLFRRKPMHGRSHRSSKS
jgi:hypothetical protein